MTPEQLGALVRTANPEDIVAAFNDVDAATRKKLSVPCQKLRRTIRTGDGKFSGRLTWEQEDAVERMWQKKHKPALLNADLAVLACGPLTEANRIELPWNMDEALEAKIANLLIVRAPDWLDDWVEKRLVEDWGGISWRMVRRFLEAGVIAKPVGAGYVARFVSAMTGYDDPRNRLYRPTSERLLDQPDYLTEDIWLLFTCENQAFLTDYHAKYQDSPANYETLPEALLKLTAEGRVDRARLLDVSLIALEQELKQNYLSGYAKFHQALTPTIDEMAARQATYIDLLTNPGSSIVSFALRVLVRLQSAKRLDTESFLDASSAVFAHKAKGSAVQALKIAKAIAADNQALAPKVTALAIAAMAHASADVQEIALDLIEDGITEADDGLRQIFERQSSNLAPKLALRAARILGDEPTDVPAAVEAEADTGHLLGEITDLPLHIREIVKLDSDNPVAQMPGALDFDVLDLTTLPDQDRFAPLADRDALFEHASRLIEEVESADEVEQLLDGIARFGHDRGGDFNRLAAPLLQRIENGNGGSGYGLGAFWSGVPITIVGLLRAWLTGRSIKTPGNRWYPLTPAMMFAVARVNEIQAMILRGHPAQLLSTPTRAYGWIEPHVLVTRLNNLVAAREPIYTADFMQSLLRLAPAGRMNALAEAGSIDGEEGRVLRFALGGEEVPTKKHKRLVHLWLCAGRARDPSGSLKQCLSPIADAVPALPNLIEPATYGWRIETKDDRGQEQSSIRFESINEFELKTGEQRSLIKTIVRNLFDNVDWAKWPLAGIHMRPKRHWYDIHEMNSPWLIEYFAMQWPLNPESYYQSGATSLADRIDEDSSREVPAHCFLSALFDQSRAWGEVAHLVLCLGLVSKSADARGFAIDALITGIETGHADRDVIVAVLGKLSGGGVLKLNRLTAALQSVAIASPLHQWWTAQIVASVITSSGKPPAQGHYLYELALECMAPLNLRPDEEMLAVLNQLKGSSKAARLARELAACDGTPVREAPDGVIHEAIQGRLAVGHAFGS